MLVEIMVASGRRAVDVMRIRSSAVIQQNGVFFATLEKDKQNSLPVSFAFEFTDELFLHPQDCVTRLSTMLSSAERPFKQVSLQRIRRKAAFRLHSLRNRKAIKLILAGVSVHEIQLALGWSDIKSLQRYIKLSPNAILALSSYEKVLNTVLEN